MTGTQIFLYVIGMLGSMAAFTAVMRIVQPPVEDVNSLARLAVKGPGGEISPWESLNPNGGLIDRVDIFLVHNLRMGDKLETLHMLLGKPQKPTPINILHMKEIAAAMVGGFTYFMSESWQLGLGVALLGFFMPDFYFKGRIEERQREIIRNFPSFVDLAALTIEAGLDYMQAFERIIKTAGKRTELEVEFERTINEISLGYSRRDALRRLAMRTGLQDFRSFVGLIIQSDELGTSLVDLLRNFGADMRFRRLNAAEKAAAQAATKMLIPIFLFIFPTVFILMLAPMMKNVFQSGGLGF
ncbi:MAG: type II secretion system F family protein [Elusimicrobia bacterium]|nr:type II secretion system F family protein [Elusimicrobiota bacterium]